MIHRRKRFVDMIWIHHRMHEQDARRQLQAGTLFPAFLEPEIVPVVDVVIVPAQPDDHGPVVDVVIVPAKQQEDSNE